MGLKAERSSEIISQGTLNLLLQEGDRSLTCLQPQIKERCALQHIFRSNESGLKSRKWRGKEDEHKSSCVLSKGDGILGTEI